MPDLISHFTLLVYPFEHALNGSDRATRLQAAGVRWLPWWRRLTGDSLIRLLDDSYFFLPYLRGLLFPETLLIPTGSARQQEELARKLASLDPAELAARLPQQSVLRLTYDPAQLAALNPVQLAYEGPGGPFTAPLQIDWIDVVLFPQQVGLLVLKVRLDEPRPSLGRLVDFLYYLRQIHPPALDFVLAQWHLTSATGEMCVLARDLVDFLLEALVDPFSSLSRSPDVFHQTPNHSPPRPRYSESGAGQVYGQIFRQFTYGCLADAADSQTAPPGLFASPVQQALYEIATCSQADTPDYAPHARGLATLIEGAHIALWQNWEGLALHDSVVFLGTGPSRFTLGGLRHNIESDYFHLYLLALFQKIRLSRLSGEYEPDGPSLQRTVHEARSLWDAFVRFRRHYWVAEATFKAQGHTLYRAFQAGLGVPRLYDQVSAEVRELQEYYERKAERHIGTLLNFLTFIGLPAGILTQLFAGALIKDATWSEFLLVAIAMYAGIGLLWLIWRWAARG